MTVKDQLKILDRKIKQNEADYDLYRQNAEIFALSSGELDKYEYLTGKNLEYKPSPLQKPKSEYSPLGQVFNKEFKKDENSEGILKILKNIGDKNNGRAMEGPRREDPDPRNIYERFRGQLTPEGNERRHLINICKILEEVQ